jgi:WD40 repeat protein
VKSSWNRCRRRTDDQPVRPTPQPERQAAISWTAGSGRTPECSKQRVHPLPCGNRPPARRAQRPTYQDRRRRPRRPHTGARLGNCPTTTTITAHTSRVRAVAWSPNSARLATACDNGLIIFWSRQGREKTSIAIQTAFCLAWLDDLIAVGHVGPPTLVKLTDDRPAETSEPTPLNKVNY